MIRNFLLATAVCLSSPAWAQAAAQSSGSTPGSPAAVPVAPAEAAPMVAVIAPSASPNILRAGTEVPMITREELTTKKKKLRVGQRVQIEVSSNIMHNGMVVIPAGTPGVAELTEVRNKGMWGKSGYIGGRIISMRLGDRQIRLSGTFDDKGITGTGGVVAAVALVPIAGFFTTGTSATIPSGSAIKAFLDEDIVYTSAQSPTPIIVPPPAPPPSVPAISATASSAVKCITCN